jgi:hypothetical protein
MDDGQEEMKAQMASLASRTEANHKKLMAAMEATHEKMFSCLEKTEACLECKEPTSEDMKSGAEHRKAPKKHVAVKPIGGLRKQHRGRNLAIECRQEPEGRTRGNRGSREKLVAAGRKMTLREGVAQGKGHGRNNVARGAPKRRTLGRRHQPKPECKSGIKDRGTRRQLRLENEKTAGRIFGKTFGREIAKRGAGSSSGLRRNKNWALLRCLPPPKRKKSLLAVLA